MSQSGFTWELLLLFLRSVLVEFDSLSIFEVCLAQVLQSRTQVMVIFP
jgi:hypothetical protein